MRIKILVIQPFQNQTVILRGISEGRLLTAGFFPRSHSTGQNTGQHATDK